MLQIQHWLPSAMQCAENPTWTIHISSKLESCLCTWWNVPNNSVRKCLNLRIASCWGWRKWVRLGKSWCWWLSEPIVSRERCCVKNRLVRGEKWQCDQQPHRDLRLLRWLGGQERASAGIRVRSEEWAAVVSALYLWTQRLCHRHCQQECCTWTLWSQSTRSTVKRRELRVRERSLKWLC